MEKRLLGLGEEPRQQTISREISRGMEVEELAHTLFHCSSLHLFENTSFSECFNVYHIHSHMDTIVHFIYK